jgi:osmotically-inducible protein OsmY
MQNVRRMLRVAAIPFLAAALFLAAACSNSADRDAAISRRIKTRLDADGLLDTGTIVVSTRNGVVTLEGDVPSQEVLLRCLAIASMDPEVSRVVDRLRTTEAPRAPRRPPIPLQASRAGAGRRESKPAEPKERPEAVVPAASPVVIPEGEAEMVLQAAVPEAAAVPGASATSRPVAVDAVAAPRPETPGNDDSPLVPGVAPWQDTAASADDAAITIRVRARIEETVPGGRILILTRRGVVTLSGLVNSDEDRRRAVRSARETEGVAGVEDRIVVVWS